MIKSNGTVKILNPVPIAVFVYDCFRLLFLLTLLVQYLKHGMGFNIPLFMYAAPNALFLLMSFSLLIRPDDFRAYIPLYITGKALSLLCMVIWLVITMGQMLNVKGILWVLFLSAADMGTIMGTALRTNSVDRQDIRVDLAEGGE
jgi:hypothetical protein